MEELQADAQRDALGDLDIVAGGIFGRQQRESGAGAGHDAVDLAAEDPSGIGIHAEFIE